MAVFLMGGLGLVVRFGKAVCYGCLWELWRWTEVEEW